MARMGRVERPAEKTHGHALFHVRHAQIARRHALLRQGHSSGPNLAGATHAVFEGGELLHAYRPARMHLSGSDPDFRAHAELAAVSELGRSVVEQDGRIDLIEETLHRRSVLRYDGFDVVGGPGFDMFDGLPNAV